MLKCSTGTSNSGWNGFVSDFSNWKVKNDEYSMCEEGIEDFFNDPEAHPPGAQVEFQPFWDTGAKAIWANGVPGYELVTFIGSPKNAED